MQIIEHIIFTSRRFHIQENNAIKDKEIPDSFLFSLELDRCLPAASLCAQNHNLEQELLHVFIFIRILDYIITFFSATQDRNDLFTNMRGKQPSSLHHTHFFMQDGGFNQ